MDDFTKERHMGMITNAPQHLESGVSHDEGIIPPKDDHVSTPPAPPPEPPENDEVIELNGEFDYEGYQVVRREFFAHMNEPSITFNNFKVYFNAICLKKFQAVDWVQALVNVDSKSLAFRLCREEEHDAVSWCVQGATRRKPRRITCKLFFANIFSLMGWNPDYRYKLLGKIVHAKDDYLIAFDLSATEVYQRVFNEGEKPKMSRAPVFPADWQGRFGLPFKEHRQAMRIDIFDGYAVYAIKDNNAVQSEEVPYGRTKNPPASVDHNIISGGVTNED
ncbi:MAG: hypothetical protein VB099_11110 [Candidatus Limiplasma sp.]|nr:hypothetical protein [Candidatus Limiplasma sp.]